MADVPGEQGASEGVGCRSLGPRSATLAPQPNNVAEYAALLECMKRASRLGDPCVMFEVDSMLLARQLAKFRPWACRSISLIEVHAECVRLGETMLARGTDWKIRHVYREFNQTSDALSNQAIDQQDSNGHSIRW